MLKTARPIETRREHGRGQTPAESVGGCGRTRPGTTRVRRTERWDLIARELENVKTARNLNLALKTKCPSAESIGVYHHTCIYRIDQYL